MNNPHSAKRGQIRLRQNIAESLNPSFCDLTELTRMVMTAGSIRLSQFVADLAQGELIVRLPDGTDCGTATCRESLIWSFRKSFAMLGAEPGDLAVFEFDLKEKSVLLRVGGLDLFDAIQNADGCKEDLETEPRSLKDEQQ